MAIASRVVIAMVVCCCDVCVPQIICDYDMAFDGTWLSQVMWICQFQQWFSYISVGYLNFDIKFVIFDVHK